MSDVLLVVVIVVALGFDFTNGFHDTANAMATSIATPPSPQDVRTVTQPPSEHASIALARSLLVPPR